MRAPHESCVAAVAVAAVAVPLTRAELGSFAAATASRIIWSGCSIPRLTPERTTGLPAKRPGSRTSTSVAKITASALSIALAGSAW